MLLPVNQYTSGETGFLSNSGLGDISLMLDYVFVKSNNYVTHQFIPGIGLVTPSGRNTYNTNYRNDIGSYNYHLAASGNTWAIFR